MGTEEPRGAVTATWEGLAVVSTHLSTVATTRRIQTSALGAIAAGAEGACLVLGDMNQSGLSLGVLTSRGFTGAFRHRTLPRARLRRQIDHILVRGAALERSWTVPTGASDHLPLVADLII
jgi:endonuclease/exonuclease/phosphatase family metal-dependent hydrolase